MNKRVYILATGYADYNLDYQRFLYDNRALLYEHKILYPWLDAYRHDFFWQSSINNKLAAFRKSDQTIIKDLANDLTDKDGLILSAPIGHLIELPALANILRSEPLFHAWHDAHITIVWLANEYSREIEGACRFNFPADTTAHLYTTAITNKSRRLAKLKSFLACADECHIMYDDPTHHIDPSVFMGKLGICVNSKNIRPLFQTDVASQFFCWFKGKISQFLPHTFHLLPSMFRSTLENYNFTFMMPDHLMQIWKAYANSLEDLCREFGHNLKFPAPHDQPGWIPFVPPDKKILQKSFLDVLLALPVADRHYVLRLLEYTPVHDWFTDDSPKLASELRHTLSINEMEEPVVSVLTLTKNHEHYIAECIESVLAQKTDFPIRHIIVDDCSTDNTRNIIEEYARANQSIWPVYLTGSGAPGRNVTTLFSRCKSEYAAICDGDDYFTDINKLQKQVEFLRKHKECSICFHPVDVVYEDGSPPRVYPPENMLPGGVRHFYTIKDMFQGNMIQTNSVMYRWRFRDGLPPWFDPSLVPADWYWHLLHAETGMIGYQKEHMAAYRRHSASLYASAEIGHVTHRAQHGLEELRVYDVCDRHFRRLYHQYLQKLANGVFADFVKIYADSDDDSLLQSGVQRFPIFAREFMAQLKFVSTRKPDVSDNN